MATTTTLFTLEHFPLVKPGDDLCQLIMYCLASNQMVLEDGDTLVLAQKIVSKSEDRYVDLDDVTPSEEAINLAKEADKDPRHMQVLLDESKEIVKVKPGVVIVEHNNGYVHANAGIDQSNIEQPNDDQRLLLLPLDPDASASALHKALKQKLNLHINILINDSFGRAWRNGTCGVCIGSAGFDVIDDKIGETDLFGNELKVTQAAVADEISAAASLVMGQADEATPVVVIRGLSLTTSSSDSSTLVRAKHEDLFR